MLLGVHACSMQTYVALPLQVEVQVCHHWQLLPQEVPHELVSPLVLLYHTSCDGRNHTTSLYGVRV